MYKRFKRTFIPFIIIASMLINFIPSIEFVYAETVTLNPTHDTFVDAVSYPTGCGIGDDANAAPRIVNWVGDWGGVFVNSKAALKFDLSTASGTVSNAQLKIYVGFLDNSNGPVTFNLHSSNDNTWTEDSTSLPSPVATPLVSGTVVTQSDAWILLDVTNYINSEVAGDKVASFVLEPTFTATETEYRIFGFCSDEDSAYKPQLYIEYTPAPSKSASIIADSAMTEANLDARYIDLTLSGDTFTDSTLEPSNFTLANAPAGLTVESVDYISDTQCHVNLAFDGTDFDSTIANLGLTIAAAELTGGSDLTATEVLTITATDDLEAISISDDGLITEGQEDGEIITVDLSGGTFAPSIDSNNWTIDNLPGGVTKGTVSKISSTRVQITLSGNATEDYDTDKTNITVNCPPSEYQDASGGGTLSDNTGVTMRANNAPTVSTDSMTDITNSGATAGGNITSNGGLPISARGVEYKKSSEMLFTAVPEGGSTTGTFTVSLTGLQANTSYDVRAYAENSEGKTYGNTVTFSTPDNPNTPPSISDILDQSTDEDTPTAAIPFTVGDAETAAGSLTVEVSSDNNTLLPGGSYTLGGSGANRTLTVAPASDQSGTALITVTIRDGSGVTAHDTFTLTVNPVNDAPTLNAILDFAIDEDADIQTVSLAGISGGGGESQNLTITAQSADTSKIPHPGVTYTSPDAVGSLSFTPAADAFGPVVITVRVTDDGSGTNTFERQFTVTLNPINDVPTAEGFSKVVNEDTEMTFTQNDFAMRFSDKESDTMTKIKVTGLPAEGTLLLGAVSVNLNDEIDAVDLGNLRYIPTANWSGTTSFTWQGFDGADYSADGTVDILVNPVNDAPTISDTLNQTINEDTVSGAVPFTVEDAESSAANLTVTATSSDEILLPQSGIVIGGTGTNRTITLTPAPDKHGIVLITITVKDESNLEATDSFILTVNPINDTPIVTAFSKTANENTQVTFTQADFTDHFADKEADALTKIKVTALPANGTLLVGTDSVALNDEINAALLGSLKYVPDLNWNGTTSFTWQGFDGADYSADGTVDITITPFNDTPTISDIADQTIDEDTASGAIPFTIGDIETSAANLTVTATSSDEILLPQSGIVIGGTGANRTITLTPTPDKHGTSLITITVKDEGNLEVTDSFTLAVNPINDIPTVTAFSKTASEDAEIAFTQTDFTDHFTDKEVDALTKIKVTALPANGTLLVGTDSVALNDEINAALLGSLKYVPNLNWNGTTSFTWQGFDGADYSTDGTVDITITPFNDTPTISDIADQTIDEDTASGAIPFTIGDIETSAANLTVTATSSDEILLPQSGIVIGGTGANRTIALTPTPDKHGTSLITITVKDEGDLEVTDSFTLAVNPINDIPTVTAFSKTANEDAEITFTQTDFTDHFADKEADALTKIKVTALPANGTLLVGTDSVALNDEINAALLGSLKYVPDLNWNGTTSFTWQGFDGADYSTDGTVDITITPFNDTPTITDIADQTINEDTASLPIAFTIGDAETSAANLVVTATSGNETVLPQSGIVIGGTGTSRTITLTPAADMHGTVTITVKVKDEGNLEATDTFVLTVSAVNDVPTAQGTAITTDEDTPKSGNLTASDKDAGSNLTYSCITAPTQGQVIINTDGSYTYTPNANYHGEDSFAWKANDGTEDSNTAVVSITVNSINDIPTTADIIKSTDEDVTVVFSASDFTNAYSDVESTDLSKIQVVTIPNAQHGTLKLEDNDTLTDITTGQEISAADLGKIRFVPTSGASKLAAEFTWKASDGTDYSAAAKSTINIGSNTDDVTAAKTALEIGYALGDSASHVTQNITLPQSGLNGTTITWSTDKESVITITGSVTRPSYTLEDTAVKVTATITKGSFTDTKVFELTVIKLPITDEEAIALDKASLAVGYASGDAQEHVTQNITLPTALENGSTVSWTSQNPAVVSTEGAVTRPLYASGDATVTLTATITKGSVTETKTFNVIVKKQPPSTNADLKALGVTNITLSPAFNKTVTVYSVGADYEINNITLTPEAEDSTASIKVNRNVLTEGKANVALSIGSNTIQVEVTAEDGTTKKTYVITVNRAKKPADEGNNNNNNNNNNNSTNNNSNQNTTPAVQILVNGQSDDRSATAAVTQQNGDTIITVSLDPQKLDQRLEQEGTNTIITIPVKAQSDTVAVDLNGQMVKNMESKDAVIVIQTEKASYSLPAAQLIIDAVGTQVGAAAALQDIRVSIEISEPKTATVEFVKSKVDEQKLEMVVNPVEFEIKCTYKDKTVDVSRFDSYVERTIAIPEGIDPSKITTGVVIGPNGIAHHVPTKVIIRDGKYYAVINSLTNSMYSVIWNPKEFPDVANHWAKKDANEAGARLIVTGTDEHTFAPNREISRGEFAAIIVRALGLKPGSTQNPFSDIVSGSWYYDAVQAAYEYGIIKGYTDGTFRPEQKISREEAMSMISNAMKVAQMNTQINDSEVKKQLESFTDKGYIGSWAQNAAALCVKYGIATGDKGALMPDNNITRAETAAMIMRLLRTANLI